MRRAHVARKPLTISDHFLRTMCPWRKRVILLRVRDLGSRVTPLTLNVLSVVPVREAVFGDVRPDVTSCRFVNVWDSFEEWIIVIYISFIVVRSLIAVLHYLPRAFCIIARDRSRRPDMSISRHVSAAVKVVNDS